MGWKDQIQVSYKLIIDLSQIDLLLNVFIFFLYRRIDESDTARSERIQKWDKFLETGEEKVDEKEEKVEEAVEMEVSEGQSTTINVSQNDDDDKNDESS